ncbi:MAG: ATP-dependent sacrificial sulfur transferase LarE [Bacteroidales bacterium]|jgi:uncharacterized protein|nr:ATP-dependent sacrificial sulfur transferase LarE [Bacteroidales bacterium]
MVDKYDKLTGILRELGRVAVAFSGGVDSAFLLAAAYETLGKNAIAITIDSPALPGSELNDAKKLVSLTGAEHVVVSMPEISATVRKNDIERCYQCKKEIFDRIISEAEARNIKYVLDGSNADDTGDYRPGMEALRELKVISPLLLAGFTKREIRDLSRKKGLPTWDKPAYACLYTRIPYGNEIREEYLKRIELSEKLLAEYGFLISRVRCHGDTARIEVEKERIGELTEGPVSVRLVAALKGYGFKYVTVDLEGYRMGSMNDMITKGTGTTTNQV